MPTYEMVLYERKGNIAYITLNRPQVLNAVNSQLSQDVADAFLEFDADPEAQIAILSGAGRAFSSGADVRQQAQRAEGQERSRPARQPGLNLYPLGNTVNWKPVIAAVHGYALGAGYGMMTDCDIIVAATGTQFEITEVRRGLGGGGLWTHTWFFTGSRFANDIALTGRMFKAEEALAQGLINQVVPKEELIAAAEGWAERIMQNPPLAVRANVRVTRWYPREMERWARNYQNALRLSQTEDARESARAFVEKRTPEFHGR